MTPQSVAEPADEPQAVLIAECRCGRPIMRLSLESAKWRHNDGAVTCPPPAAAEVPNGEAGPVGWFVGRDDPPFNDLVKGDRS